MTGRVFYRAFACSFVACAVYVWVAQARYQRHHHHRYGPLDGRSSR